MANMAGQEVALYVNALDRTIQKNGVTKAINDDFWTSDIVPILYPVWDSDRDKLESYISTVPVLIPGLVAVVSYLV